MTWNYRIIRHPGDSTSNDWFAVHEVHYDAAGNPVGVTERPVTPGGTTLEEVIEDMGLMRAAADKPTLDYVLFANMQRGNNGSL